MSAEPFLKIAQNKGLLTGSRLQASLYVCSGPVGLAVASHPLLYWRWGLLHPTPTPQEPRQTGQTPLKHVYGPRAVALELGW